MRIYSLLLFGFVVAGVGAFNWKGQILRAFERPMSASEEASIERDLEFTFKAWIEDEKPKKAGLIAVFPSGKVSVVSHGGIDMDEQRAVASLSKAVTGLCTAGLVMDGKLQLEDKMAVVLADYFSKHGYPRGENSHDITIAHLLSHRAGFFSNDSRKKSAFYRGFDRVIQAKGVRETYLTELVTAAFSQELVAPPGSQYIYSNTNYLVLGFIIEQIANQPYEQYCAERVLSRAGVQASLDPDGKILGSYAGWLLSPLDTIKIFELFDPRRGFLSNDLLAWHSSPVGKTLSEGSSYHYGLGSIVTDKFGSYWNHHGGKWAGKNRRRDLHGSLANSFLTLVINTDEGVGIFMVAEPSLNKQAYRNMRDWIFNSYNRGLEAAGGAS